MDPIIRNIEVKYFRSAYGVRMRGLRPLNILTGRNDAGKSNILRALNLFFNNMTDWSTPIEFYEDFTKQRLDEVRQTSIKGRQFISVIIDFARPTNYSPSLPEVFQVVRTWYRHDRTYTETSNLDKLMKQGKLPGTIATARRSLAQFLNKTHFEYIPAVKDRAYFESLLSRLQKTLLDASSKYGSSISETADSLAQEVQHRISLLKQDFEAATGISSFVAPPKKLSSLFQAFRVSTITGRDHDIPLTQRGDGIQARYIPSVLKYICTNSTDFFVWGFEEPENSLEYSHVIDIAEDFRNNYSRSAQIFVTTHSPALTSLTGERVCCIRVRKDDQGLSQVTRVWPEPTQPDERSVLYREMGFMRIQEGMHTEYVRLADKKRQLESVVDSLNEESARRRIPLVMVEGKTDVQILKTAWSKLYPDHTIPFLPREVDPVPGGEDGGAGGAGTLGKAIEVVHPSEERLCIAIFDRDEAGLRAFNGLTDWFRPSRDDESLRVHINDFAYAMLLPVPADRNDYAEYESLSLEFLFDDETLDTKTDDGRGLVLREPELSIVVKGGKRIRGIDAQQIAIHFPDLCSVRTIVDGKNVFADEIVPTLSRDKFENFKQLFAKITDILSP